jgi:hypothetical protein
MKSENQDFMNMTLIEELRLARKESDELTELNHQQWRALENIRLYVARLRTTNKLAADEILRFCYQGGVRGHVLREDEK